MYLKNMENLPLYGNTSMEIGTLGKFPCIYGDMPREGEKSGNFFRYLTVMVVKKLQRPLAMQ
jgi:hypothetical protein